MQLNEKAVFLSSLTSNMKKNVTVTCFLFCLHIHDQRQECFWELPIKHFVTFFKLGFFPKEKAFFSKFSKNLIFKKYTNIQFRFS